MKKEKKKKKKVGKKGGDEAKGEEEEGGKKKKKKRNAAAEVTTQATPKKTKKGDAATPTTPAKSSWKKKPRIEWELSRDQVMCRTGKGGPGSTHRIGFKESGSPKKAWSLAEKWLEKQMAKWKAATG